MKRTTFFLLLGGLVALLGLVLVPAPVVRAATTWIVNDGSDDGTANAANCPGTNCRLRDAIAAASSGDTIHFAADFTIPLTAQLDISKNLTIDGENHKVMLDGQNSVRILFVGWGVTFNLNALTVARGYTNIANDGGSGIKNNHGTVKVSHSAFSDNQAAGTGLGGGILNYVGTLTVSNSTFSGNVAYRGGGIINESGTVTVVNSTFSGNSGNEYGGGIFNEDSLTLKNTILANNPTGGNCDNDGTITDGGGNLEDANDCGFSTSLTNTDPNLGALADNGGPTQTFALAADSPALDAGDDTICAAAPVNNHDQRGVTRPQGTHCDIGAYEREASSQTGPHFIVTQTGDKDRGTCSVFFCTLREAINAANAYAGAATITFNIPHMTDCTSANVCTILLAVISNLPCSTLQETSWKNRFTNCWAGRDPIPFPVTAA